MYYLVDTIHTSIFYIFYSTNRLCEQMNLPKSANLLILSRRDIKKSEKIAAFLMTDGITVHFTLQQQRIKL